RHPCRVALVAGGRAPKRVGLHQLVIEDEITRDVDKAVLAPGLEGMQLRPERLEERLIAKALALAVDDDPMAHAQFIVAARHWGAIRELFAWHVKLHHALAHDADGHLAPGGHGE